MSRTIEIIDPEQERKTRRQRKLLILAAMLSLCLFGYPVAKEFRPQWQALKAARKLGLYLSMLKTRAILTKLPLEARFKAPDIIEVYEVSSCGPNSLKTKLWDVKLSDFEADVQFASEQWVREEAGIREPILPRFCYDPLYGSSIHADGIAHGGIFLVHRQDLESRRIDHLVQVNVEGASGDLSIE